MKQRFSPIRDARKSAGLSREQLCVKAGITLATLQNLESGRRTGCRLETARNIATVLGTTVDVLFPIPPQREAA